MTVHDGHFALSLPVAENERRGVWTLMGTDLYTGLNGSVMVTVE